MSSKKDTGDDAALPSWQLVAFTLPVAPLALTVYPLVAILPNIYAKHTEVTLAAVGAVLFWSRIFDAVSDPLIGYFSDSTSGRFGRRKPWMAAGSLLAAVAAYEIFTPMPSDDGLHFMIWSLALYLGLTCIAIPYSAWTIELSHRYTERARISTFVSAGATLGSAIVVGAPVFLAPLLGSSEITPEYLSLVAAGLLIAIPAFVGAGLGLTPRGRDLSTAAFTARGLIHSLRINRPLRVYLLGYGLWGIGHGITLPLGFIFFDTHLGIGDRFPLVMIIFFAVQFMMMPVWLQVIKLVGKHKAWALSWVANAFVAPAFFFIEPGPGSFLPALAVQVVLAGLSAANYIIPVALLGDVIDYDTWKTRKNHAGNYSAVLTLISKTNMAIGGSLGFFLLSLVSYEVGGENSPEKTLSFLGIFVIISGALLLIASVPIWRFPIDKRRQEIIRRRLESRVNTAGVPEGT